MNENSYLQEIHRQGQNLFDEISILVDDYNKITDLSVKVKIKSVIEKKEKRLLELKKEVAQWELETQH